MNELSLSETRGVFRDRQTERGTGPWNYFFFYSCQWWLCVFLDGVPRGCACSVIGVLECAVPGGGGFFNLSFERPAGDEDDSSVSIRLSSSLLGDGFPGIRAGSFKRV